MSDQNKLTAEVVSKELQGFFTGRKPLDGKNPEYPATLIKEYANQQTAEKDARISDLLAWKRQQMETFAPLLDYGQKADSGIKIGASIVAESIDALKSRKEKDDKLKAYSVACKQLEGGLKEKDARIKELEKEVANCSLALMHEKGFDAEAKKESNLNMLHNEHLTKELEAVKKERDEARGLAEQLAKANSSFYLGDNALKNQRDEAVKLLERWHDKENGSHDPILVSDRDNLLSRLSSGETKPEFHCNNKGRHFSDPGFKPVCDQQCDTCKEETKPEGIECPECKCENKGDRYTLCETCYDFKQAKEINPSNNSSSEQETKFEAAIRETAEATQSPWISVEDRPLVENLEDGGWSFDHEFGEFLAAVPYTDKRYPGQSFWWIKHCVVEDEIGLCVVGDDENDPAGYRIQDVTHYWPLPAPPESLTDKTT